MMAMEASVCQMEALRWVQIRLDSCHFTIELVLNGREA